VLGHERRDSLLIDAARARGADTPHRTPQAGSPEQEDIRFAARILSLAFNEIRFSERVLHLPSPVVDGDAHRLLRRSVGRQGRAVVKREDGATRRIQLSGTRNRQRRNTIGQLRRLRAVGMMRSVAAEGSMEDVEHVAMDTFVS